MSDLANVHKVLEEAIIDGMKKDPQFAGKFEAGWVYRDFPQMLEAYWKYILDGIGEGEFIKITEANYGNGFMRGQLLVSPQGLKNIKAYKETHPLPDTTIQ